MIYREVDNFNVIYKTKKMWGYENPMRSKMIVLFIYICTYKFEKVDIFFDVMQS